MPVKDFAFVTFKDEVKAKVEIYSVSGTLVKTIHINNSSKIDLSGLTKRYYTLKVVSGKSNYA